jgi:hypothetical protein
VAAGGDLRRPALLLAAAFAGHNLEEGFAFPAMRKEIADRADGLGIAWWSPGPTTTSGALLALTLVASAGMLWAALGPPTNTRRTLVRALAWVMLANVMLPHVPAAIFLGGYAPGLVTAVAINLPLSLWVLRKTRTG